MEEQYLCDGLFDEEAIKNITTLVDKVEQGSGCEVVIVCPHSIKQVIKEAFPNKSVLSLSSEFMTVDDGKILIVPNTKGVILKEINKDQLIVRLHYILSSVCKSVKNRDFSFARRPNVDFGDIPVVEALSLTEEEYMDILERAYTNVTGKDSIQDAYAEYKNEICHNNE